MLSRSQTSSTPWLGTNLENMSVAQIAISTAPHESQTLAFNYASLALNNSFFLHHLVSFSCLLLEKHNHLLHGTPLETPSNRYRSQEPRISAERKVAQPRAHTHPRRRDLRANGLATRSQDLRDSRSDGHAQLQRLRLARHRRPGPPRRRTHLRSRHVARPRAQTIPWPRTRRTLRTRGVPIVITIIIAVRSFHPITAPATAAAAHVPGTRPRAPTSSHRSASRRTYAHHERTGVRGNCRWRQRPRRAPHERMVRFVVVHWSRRRYGRRGSGT
jgi:hypothetical protein